MKPIILAIILLFTSFSFAQSVQSDKTDSNYHAHSGIYFSTGITFGLESLSNNAAIHSLGDSEWNKSFDGFLTPLMEVRLGGYIRNIVSVYGLFGVGFGTGDYKDIYYDMDHKEAWHGSASATTTRMHFGIGTEFYPIQNNESLFYGLFLGLSVGYAFEDISISHNDEHNSSNEECNNIFERIEAGYDWWLSSHWKAGVSLNFTLGRYFETINNAGYEDDEETTKSQVIGLTIRIAH